MVGVRKAQFDAPRTARQGARDSGLPPVKRPGGVVVRPGGIPFSGGTHYEIWTGRWKKGAGEVGGERVEKVNLCPTTPILLI